MTGTFLLPLVLKRRPLLKKRILDEEPISEKPKEGESEVVREKEKSAEDEVREMGTSDWPKIEPTSSSSSSLKKKKKKAREKKEKKHTCSSVLGLSSRGRAVSVGSNNKFSSFYFVVVPPFCSVSFTKKIYIFFFKLCSSNEGPCSFQCVPLHV